MYLYQATKDPFLLEVGADMLESIEQETRTKCGYATVRIISSLFFQSDPDKNYYHTATKVSVYQTQEEQFFFHSKKKKHYQ